MCVMVCVHEYARLGERERKKERERGREKEEEREQKEKKRKRENNNLLNRKNDSDGWIEK